jgi:hypothetical protein
MLRETFLSLATLVTLFVAVFLWLANNAKERMLVEASNMALRESNQRYNRFLSDHEYILALANSILTDSNISPKSYESIAKSIAKSSEAIYGVSIGDSLNNFQYSGNALSPNELKMFNAEPAITDSVVWSKIYSVQNSKAPLLSARIQSRYQARVIDIKMDLRVLYNMLNSIAVTQNSEVFLYNAENLTVFNPVFYAATGNKKIEQVEQTFVPFQLAGSTQISEALEQIRLGKKEQNGSVMFHINGAQYCLVSTATVKSRQALRIAVIVPESDLFSLLKREMSIVLLTGALFGLIGSNINCGVW